MEFSASYLPVLQSILSQALVYVPKLLLAGVTLVIGLRLIKVLTSYIKKGFDRAQTDASLASFLMSFTGISLKILLGLSVAAMIGIQMTSFVALVGAAGLAIGLSLQGSLANVAGGVLILTFKPFEVGEVIEVEGVSGVVKKILIVNTIISTPDGRTVYIPNSTVSNGIVHNYSDAGTRRVRLIVGIGYGDSIDKARGILEGIAKENVHVLADQDVFIGVENLGDNAVELVFETTVKTDDFKRARYQLLESIKTAFDKEGVSFPYPQRDVHLHQIS